MHLPMLLPTLEELTDNSTWNRRYRQMQEMLHDSLKARKLIVRALIILAKKKDLSFGERKMYDHARKYVRYRKEHNKKVIQMKKRNKSCL